MLSSTEPSFNPQQFLAALGAGGLAISFFLYPMFMVPHPETPMVNFEALLAIFQGQNALLSTLLAIDLIAVAIFAFVHFHLLVKSLIAYRRYRLSSSYEVLRRSNREVSLMAIPLTLSMSVNVVFVLGSLFIPGLWSVVEWLFPAALVVYALTGLYALRIYGAYFSRLLINGDFNFDENNNLSQLLAIFAFSMIATGLAGPGAMSHSLTINALGIFGSLFFLSLAVLLAVVKLVLGMISMLRQGISTKSSYTLWILIPILTLFGISVIRITMGLHHGFEAPLSRPGLFVFTSVVFSLEILVGVLGYRVMKQLGYFDQYLRGDRRDAGSFALICPGVAFFVFGFFFIIFGLVKNGLVTPMSPGFFLLLAPLIWVQMKTIAVFLKLNCQVLGYGFCRVGLGSKA
jgi:xanthosine utilization system XapX-like protein